MSNFERRKGIIYLQSVIIYKTSSEDKEESSGAEIDPGVKRSISFAEVSGVLQKTAASSFRRRSCVLSIKFCAGRGLGRLIRMK